MKEQIKAAFGDMVIKKELHIVDVLAVSLSPEDAKTTAAIPGVLRVVPDKVTISARPGPVIVHRHWA